MNITTYMKGWRAGYEQAGHDIASAARETCEDIFSIMADGGEEGIVIACQEPVDHEGPHEAPLMWMGRRS